MNRLLIGSAAASLLLAFAPSVAQPAPPPPGVAQVTGPATSAPQLLPRHEVRMKIMSDRVMTRADVGEHVRRLFARFDSNHDGFITREEIASAGKGMMAMHRDMEKRVPEHAMMMGDRSALFDRLDTNHDGSISRQEFMASRSEVREQRVIIMHPDGAATGQSPMPGMQEMRMHAMGGFGGHLFETADANHDGRVSLQEAQAAALAHFDRADLNHDGKLTPEERQQAHELMREHHRS